MRRHRELGRFTYASSLPFIAWYAALLLSLTPHTARADELAGDIAKVVAAANLGDGLSVHIVDLKTGRERYGLRADTERNPASNMKILTAAAALATLGPEYTLRTGLYGFVRDGVMEELVLRGEGDPTLTIADLDNLVRGLKERGVREVRSIKVDGSAFDDRLLPPAFDQQPHEHASFRAAIGAVALDRGSFFLRVNPGAAPGAPAEVILHGPGYFEVQSSIRTGEPGEAPNIIADQGATEDGSKMWLRLRGVIPAGSSGVRYRRRVENPLAHAAHVLAELVENHGLADSPSVSLGATRPDLPLLVYRESLPLSQLLAPVGKQSDNFVAEMVLKILGMSRQRPASSEEGLEAMRNYLRVIGIPDGEGALVNGSGLFVGNRISARHLTTVLLAAYRDAGIRSEFVAHLAIGGVDGTLARRLQAYRSGRIVRAKTGTLNDVISLSGYVLGRSPEEGYAFAILANGVRGRQAEARRLSDQIVEVLVKTLY